MGDSLTYHVTQPLPPEDGFLIRLEDPIHPIESFTQKDVDMLKIAYRPPLHGSAYDRLLEVSLEIADPEGLVSEPIILMINIHPASYLGPFIVLNMGLTLYEGEAATIASSKNLAVADEDNYGNVTLRVTSGLAHGRLLKGDSSVKHFVAADLEIGSLLYKHDGSDTTADSLVLQMRDGQHQVEFLLAVTILPVDDEPPMLLANTGILVHTQRDFIKITNQTLRAKDAESPNEGVFYRLVPSSSVPGYFFLKAERQNVEEAK